MDGVLDGVHDTHSADSRVDILGIAVLEDAFDVLLEALEIDHIAGNIVVRQLIFGECAQHLLGPPQKLLLAEVALAFPLAVIARECTITTLLEGTAVDAWNHDLELHVGALWKDHYHITNQG